MSFRLFENVDTPSSPPRSVADIIAPATTRDWVADHRQYTHHIERELSGSSVPRLVCWTKTTRVLRRVLWNTWLAALAVIVYFARQDYETYAMFASLNQVISGWWGALALIVSAGFGLVIWFMERRWHRQLHLLRGGVAVPGWISALESGSGQGHEFYSVNYCYRDGHRTWETYTRVTRREYQSLLGSNPYRTVLYDPNNAENSLLYLQIHGACFVEPADSRGTSSSDVAGRAG